MGGNLIQQVLRGSRNQRVTSLGLDKLSTYGLMKDKDRRLIQDYIDCLKEKGYLYLEPAYETLRPGPQADQVLFHGEKVIMEVQIIDDPPMKEARPAREERRRHPAREGGGMAAPAVPEENGLLAALREKRTQLAQAAQVPAYLVFSNATLADMAAKSPSTIEEFMEVSGVGQVKAARYGTEFLRVISDYWDEERRRRHRM